MLKILQESITEERDLGAGPSRYKLIIDPSEDDSMISYLFKCELLIKEKTKVFISSKLFRDHEIQKVCNDDIATFICLQ